MSVLLPPAPDVTPLCFYWSVSEVLTDDIHKTVNCLHMWGTESQMDYLEKVLWSWQSFCYNTESQHQLQVSQGWYPVLLFLCSYMRWTCPWVRCWPQQSWTVTWLVCCMMSPTLAPLSSVPACTWSVPCAVTDCIITAVSSGEVVFLLLFFCAATMSGFVAFVLNFDVGLTV